jgi:hypothetical protein
MNEVELIRAQLNLERQHAAQVARACASALAAASAGGTERLAALEAFRQAGVDYLAWILSRFEEREQVFHDLLRKRYAAEDPNRRAVEAALALPGSSREALTKLETALRSADTPCEPINAWTDFLRFFTDAWISRRDEIDRLFERQAKVTDWRTVSDIDADSIVAERDRYARVKATLPNGIEMSLTATRT